jgi:hypothetical protein
MDMTPDLARRTLLAASCLGAPAFGVVAALATPALATTPSTELHEIAASPDAYYVYGLCILLSSMLLVPAVFALVELIRPHRAWGALLTCVVAQIGMLVAVGDSASELVFWQMGARRADLPAMIAATDGFDSAPGASLIYTIGGLCTLVGVLALGILLWRTRALAWWAAAALPVGAIANVAGFSVASRPTLTASYVLIAVALVPAAAAILRQSAAPEPSPTSITSPAPLGAHD